MALLANLSGAKMAKEFGLTPDMLADGASDILDPPKEKPIQVAELPTSIRERIRSSAPAAPAAITARDPGDLVREEKQKERERIELETKLKKEQGAATAARQAKIYKEYEPQLSAAPPKFEAPKETFTQLAGLGMMMMMMGSMAGGKTYGSAIGAMNGLAGMLKGYQEGRKEAYDRSKTTFDENLKAWKENKAQVKEAFTRALKLGSKDINTATNEVIKELTAANAPTAAEIVRKRGLATAAQAFNVASENSDKSIDMMRVEINRMAGIQQPTEGGVELAGDPAGAGKLTGTPGETTKQRIERLRREESDAAIELEVLKARKTYAPPAASGGQDPQWVKAEGELFRATKDERQQMRDANIAFEYATGPKSTTTKQAPIKIKGDDGRTYYADREGTILLDKEGKPLQAPETRSAGAEIRYSFNVAESLGQAINDVVNVQELPRDSVLGNFAGLTGEDAKGTIDGLKKAFARTVTDEDNRMFEQLIGGLEQNLSRALGGGYASSTTSRNIQAYRSQVAREGDTPIAKAIFLARIRQEIDTLADFFEARPGAKDFIPVVKKYQKNMQDAIPFTVKDVIAARDQLETLPIGKDKNATNRPASGGSRPTLQQFIQKAKPLNPTMTDQQLIDYYNQTYGAR